MQAPYPQQPQAYPQQQPQAYPPQQQPPTVVIQQQPPQQYIVTPPTTGKSGSTLAKCFPQAYEPFISLTAGPTVYVHPQQQPTVVIEEKTVVRERPRVIN